MSETRECCRADIWTDNGENAATSKVPPPFNPPPASLPLTSLPPLPVVMPTWASHKMALLPRIAQYITRVELQHIPSAQCRSDWGLVVVEVVVLIGYIAQGAAQDPYWGEQHGDQLIL